MGNLASPGGSSPASLWTRLRTWWRIHSRKSRKLAYLDNRFADQPPAASLAKALWLTRRGLRCQAWGNLLGARNLLSEAIAAKADFFPAHLGLAATYRQMAKETGLLSNLVQARGILESIPQRMSLLGQEISLELFGATFHAEWANLHLYQGQWQEASDRLSLALLAHQQIGQMDSGHLRLLEDLGLPGPSAVNLGYLRRIQASASRYARDKAA